MKELHGTFIQAHLIAPSNSKGSVSGVNLAVFYVKQKTPENTADDFDCTQIMMLRPVSGF